jgi:hypothetical protein
MERIATALERSNKQFSPLYYNEKCEIVDGMQYAGRTVMLSIQKIDGILSYYCNNHNRESDYCLGHKYIKLATWIGIGFASLPHKIISYTDITHLEAKLKDHVNTTWAQTKLCVTECHGLNCSNMTLLNSWTKAYCKECIETQNYKKGCPFCVQGACIC